MNKTPFSVCNQSSSSVQLMKSFGVETYSLAY